MSFIQTVLGRVLPCDLGVCYAHEHIIIDDSFTTFKAPDFRLADTVKAIDELRQFYADGGRAMVDSMPCDSGRNIRKLVEVSRQSGVHIVAPTGLHLSIYYDPGHWGNFYTEAQLADLFIADIEQGIDGNDYGGPFVERTKNRAGVIKVATGTSINSREKKIFSAAAQAHRETGCPILTHTEQGLLGMEQIAMLSSAGVALSHVVLSHTDRHPDPAYHRELLATGVCLEYDSAFRWKPAQGNATLDLLVELLPEFPNQIMLGMDAARRSYWRAHGGQPGLSFLLNEFTQRMRELGIPESLIQQCFVDNPANAYAFVE